jgi:hypothetical protein
MNKPMLFLREWAPNMETLTEQTSDGKVLYLEGPMIMTEKRNRNGRIYEKAMMESSVDSYIQTYLNANRAIGELNHPDYPFPNIKEAAVYIESLTWQGTDVIGKARVLNNIHGQQIKSLVEAGFRMGMSTRGLGNVVERSGQKYVTEYMLNAIDAVDMPSGQNCYMNALKESTEWVQEGGIWVEKENREKAQALFLEKFEQLIQEIKKSK